MCVQCYFRSQQLRLDPLRLLQQALDTLLYRLRGLIIESNEPFYEKLERRCRESMHKWTASGRDQYFGKND